VGQPDIGHITPDVGTSIVSSSDEQIIATVSHGVRNDETLLSPIMPWQYFEGIRLEDLKGIVAWLRTLKAGLERRPTVASVRPSLLHPSTQMNRPTWAPGLAPSPPLSHPD
jgi:hypothetical protein